MGGRNDIRPTSSDLSQCRLLECIEVNQGVPVRVSTSERTLLLGYNFKLQITSENLFIENNLGVKSMQANSRGNEMEEDLSSGTNAERLQRGHGIDLPGLQCINYLLIMINYIHLNLLPPKDGVQLKVLGHKTFVVAWTCGEMRRDKGTSKFVLTS